MRRGLPYVELGERCVVGLGFFVSSTALTNSLARLGATTRFVQ